MTTVSNGPDEPRAQPGSITRRLAATTRVLVIEDEHDIADFLRAYFRASGFDLVHSDPDDVAGAVDAVAEHDADCVLLDVRLRGFSGLEVHRRLRDDPRFTFVPVILVSADTSAGVRAVGVAGGLDGFVPKPFSVESLAELVSGRVRRARRLAEEGSDERLGLLGPEFLAARLADELNAAAHDPHRRAVGLALLRVGAAGDVRSQHGDEAGDWVGRRVVQRLREALPPSAVIARSSDDELAVVLAGLAAAAISPCLHDALDAVNRALELPGGAPVAIGATGGVAWFPDHAASPDELYMAADAALVDALDRGVPLTVAR